MLIYDDIEQDRLILFVRDSEILRKSNRYALTKKLSLVVVGV